MLALSEEYTTLAIRQMSFCGSRELVTDEPQGRGQLSRSHGTMDARNQADLNIPEFRIQD
jgi:hypothetical protein